jgi:hypothetical protein
VGAHDAYRCAVKGKPISGHNTHNTINQNKEHARQRETETKERNRERDRE